MKLEINDNRKIADIQNDFNTYFPYLKIEFFSKPHKKKEGSLKSLMIPIADTLKKYRQSHNNGSISIIPQMTVSDLEQQFNEIFGLSAQVFRKSGKIWLETTITDSWTLEEQNKQGESLSKQVA